MTIKNIALALLAVPAMANQHCEPEAAQPHFSVELAGGGCTMNGHVQSKTTNPDIPTPTFKDFKASWQNPPGEEGSAEVSVLLDMLMGYRANWNKMIPLPSQMGFAGQINMHWNYMCNGMGAGLYAGVGYNASRSSSTIPASFDPTIQRYEYTKKYKTADASVTQDIQSDTLINSQNNRAISTPQDLCQKTNIPMGKATVSSGLMFQAGTRLGAMIGNVFPHVRLGWACYQFKAQMTNQRAQWNNDVAIQAASPCAVNVADGNIVIENTAAAEQRVNIGVNAVLDAFDAAYTTSNPIKIASKSQWTNAVTIGAGVDWAFNRMTLGFFYQVGICQKLTFKKWNKNVTAGLTAAGAKFLGPDTRLNGDNEYKPTGGMLKMNYDKSTPEVSIAPVMHTAMVSVKYVLGKAA
jgi:opacity protein-like surface antigen